MSDLGRSVGRADRGSREAGPSGGSGGGDWELLLLRLRYRDGRAIQVSSNRPVLLDDVTTAWVVYSGRVDVFAVPLGPDRVPGPRRYLFSAESGDALFGFDPAEHASGLLVSGPPGTQLLRTRVAGLEQLGRSAEFRPLLARLIDGWIARLWSALIHELPPRTFVTLVADQPRTVPAGTAVRSRDGVMWVRQDSVGARLLGRSDLAELDGSWHLPLAPAAWIVASQPSELSGRTTASLLTDGEIWTELARFHRLAHRLVADEESRQRRAEAARRAAADQADERLFESALARLTHVLDPSRRDGRAGEAALDPLVAACRLVADAQGLTIVRPANREAGGDDRFAAIARASHLRTRRVTLPGAWWLGDHGPAVGYLTESGQPVALLPDRNGYRLVDPADGTSRPVDAAVARTLSPRAETFYRRFEDRALSARSLLLFGLRDCWPDLLRVLLVAVAVGVLAMAGPIATGLLFDLVIPGSHLGLLLQVGAGLALAALASGAFEVVREATLLRLGARFQASLEPAIMDRLLDLPGRFFRDFTAGDLAGRALAVSAIRDALTGPALAALLASVFSGFSLLLLFWYAPRLALVACALLVPLLLVLVFSSIRLIHQHRQMAELGGQLSSLVLQLLNGIAKLRVAGAEARAFAQWAETLAAQRRAAYTIRSIVNRQAVVAAGFPVLALFAIFAAVAISPEGPPAVGAFVAFTTAFIQFVTGALALLQASSTLVQALPAYERARPILDAAPEVDGQRDDPGELSGAIDVDHVTFRYDPQGPPILDDVSLHCRPGEFVALVGPSGSGKSTLLRLLLGFEQAESGAIFYDGRDLAMLDVRLVRRQIGSVLQNGRLLPGDIFSNIVGSSPLTLDDAWEAARLAGFAEDVEQMPMGMHTVIGEGGDTLSGGQRQRLMIARAIVHRPRIIFFDEATSALDNRTQEIVGASLNSLAVTRVVIAHRLSTIVNADRIYVLQQGRIVESGTYRELMQRRGVFAELARRQIA